MNVISVWRQKTRNPSVMQPNTELDECVEPRKRFMQDFLETWSLTDRPGSGFFLMREQNLRAVVMPWPSCGNGWALSLLRGKSTASAAGLSTALKHRGNERRTSRAESVRRSVSVFLQISETQEMLLSFYFIITRTMIFRDTPL